MYALLLYLCKLSISLAVVYLFYQLVLRPLTFYQWNRWYLLLYTALCFYIPFIDLMPVLDKSPSSMETMVYLVPNINSIIPEASWFESLEYWDYLILMFGIGVVIFIVKFLVQIFSLYRLKKKATLIHDESVKMYDVPIEGLQPFSFGKNIFLNTDMHSSEDLEKIVAHEFVHVAQKHSIDVLWVELLCIVQWYNPFVWLIKRSVKQNLEFIADQNIVNTGLDKKEYQYLLLKVIGNKQFSITNNFNFQSLKNRIKMMNKLRSTKIHLTKFLFMLPVVALLLLSFRNQIKEIVVKTDKETLFNEQLPYQKPDLITSTVISKKSIKNQKQKAFVIKDTVPKGNGKIVIKGDTLILRGGSGTILRNPLYVIDGKAFFNENDISNIDAKNIESITVLKDKAAVELYGENGKNGVIIIDLKRPISSDTLVEKVVVGKAKSKSINNDFREVVVAGHPKGNELKEVRIEDIKYNISRSEGYKASGNGEGKTSIVVRGRSQKSSLDNYKEALIIVDGEPMTRSKFDKINPDTIVEIEVLKEASAQKYYGNKGKNGVLVITTRK